MNNHKRFWGMFTYTLMWTIGITLTIDGFTLPVVLAITLRSAWYLPLYIVTVPLAFGGLILVIDDEVSEEADQTNWYDYPK